jgi:hypothetical protein
MKKFSILIAALALMAMTACNEKVAKNDENTEANATEQVHKAGDSVSAVKVEPMEKAAPTADGKDHTVAKFNTKEYEVTVENLANGNYRVTMKDGKDDKVYETSNCRIQGQSYLMQTEDGTNVLINGKDGKIVVMNKSGIIYKGASK